MKRTIYFVLGCIITLQGCSSQKKLEQTAPFTVQQPSCQEWVGGKEESGKGYTLEIPLVKDETEAIQFKEVYFRGSKMAAKVEQDNGRIKLICNNISQDLTKPDIVMHADGTKEVGNQPPKLDENKADFPFELNSDQAIISYTINGDANIKYFKIEGIADKPSRIYRSRPQN